MNRAEHRPERTLTIKEMTEKEHPQRASEKQRHGRKIKNMGPWEKGKGRLSDENYLLNLVIRRLLVM